MRGRSTIKGSLPILVLAYARSKGVDVDALLRRFELSPNVESQLDLDMAVETANSLMDAIATTLGDPFLGVHVAVQYQRGSYHLFEFAVRNSPDLRGAVLRMVRFASILNDSVTFSFAESGSKGAITHRLEGLGRQASEFTIAVIYLMARELARQSLTPDAVWFAHEAPAEVGELVSIFGTDRIQFGRESNGLRVGREVLDLPVVGADPALLRTLESELARQAPPPGRPAAPEIVADTERVVKSTLELGAPRIENVAQSLGTSVRTLQRRLDEAGTSFNEVVEQIRERLAREHVTRGELTSTQMAFVLGYADVSAFLRAFKRWTGFSPQDYRGGKRTT